MGNVGQYALSEKINVDSIVSVESFDFEFGLYEESRRRTVSATWNCVVQTSNGLRKSRENALWPIQSMNGEDPI